MVLDFDLCNPNQPVNTEAQGGEGALISKASATGMSQLSLQGWIHGDFVFNAPSLTRHPNPQTTSPKDTTAS